MFVNLPTFFGALVLQFKFFASAANEEEFGFAIARVSLQATTKSPQGEEAAQGSDDDELLEREQRRPLRVSPQRAVRGGVERPGCLAAQLDKLAVEAREERGGGRAR